MIELSGVTKTYEDVAALKGITFTVPTGSICGFIGPNGAGKTTTLKILSTLLRPSSGSARIMGVDVRERPDEVRRLVGWMPDQYGVYLELRVWEYLDFFAASYGIPRRRRRDVIEMVLDLVDLTPKRDSRVGELSRGMTQKLCLGRALVHEPQVLLLDEPASGLDPEARIELRELFKELQRMGKTILVSSHILPELAEYCSGVTIIQGGEVKFSGSLTELSASRAEGSRLFCLKVLESPERAVGLLKTRPEVRRAAVREDGEIELQLAGDDRALSVILEHLVANRAGVLSFREAQLDLGDVFLKITGSDHA